jgi:hypothetical protein
MIQRETSDRNNLRDEAELTSYSFPNQYTTDVSALGSRMGRVQEEKDERTGYLGGGKP